MILIIMNKWLMINDINEIIINDDSNYWNDNNNINENENDNNDNINE